MSKLSIYENGWINLVFEGKNKAYGAYQLRQQSDRITLLAFLGGLAFVSGMACIYLLAHLLNGNPDPIALPETLDRIIHLEQYQKPVEIPEIQAQPSAPQQSSAVTESWENPQIVHPTEATATEATPQVTAPINGTDTHPQNDNGPAVISNNPPIAAVPDNVIRKTIELDKQPEFPGGIEKFYQFIGRNYKNPDLDEPQLYRVMVSFVIEKDGSMTDIRILRDPGYGMGQEAMRVLESLQTKWKPGLLNGQNVRTSYTLPIVVKIM
ncbi:MAG: energy transducer TonB [Bacteroidetes bacterium]|nr:energy transducer TonB [Bacteroidota bacterium]